MAILDQTTSQKLEENPLLPIDTQTNLVYTLTRIFRVLAQIVNPIVAWVANWKNVVVSNAATNTQLTVSAPDPTGSAYLNANKKGATTECGLVGQHNGFNRWFVNVGNQSAESGSNAGSDFGIYRYNDAGTLIDQPFSINRASGQAYCFTGITLSPPISWGAGAQMSLVAPAGSQTYASIAGFKGSGKLRWQVQPGNGEDETGTNTGSNCGFYRYSDTGVFLGTPLLIRRSDGTLFAENAFRSSASSISTSNYSFFADSYIGIGGGNWATNVIQANPNWGAIQLQGIHVPGSWAGWRFNIGGQVYDFTNTGNAYANANWLSYSDARLKTNAVQVTDAMDKVAVLKAYEYDRTDITNMDGTPRHQAGLIAQEVEQVFPVAVHQTPRAVTDFDGEPMRSLAYEAITALNTQALADLIALVRQQGDRIAALESAAP